MQRSFGFDVLVCPRCGDRFELGGAEYIAVCVPAFSMDTVHRDPE